MNKTKTAYALLAVLCAWAIGMGCKNPDVVAFKTAGTLEASVDKAMKGWADYVVWQGKQGVTLPAQEAKIKQSYTNYRLAMNTLYDARAKYVQDKAAGQPVLEAAVTAAGTAASAVITIINSYLPVERQIK